MSTEWEWMRGLPALASKADRFPAQHALVSSANKHTSKSPSYTVITSFSLCSETSLIRVMCWSVSFWI